MIFPADERAVYHPPTESVRTGGGQHLRLREIHAAFTAVNPYQFRNITRRAGVSRGIEDPFEKGQANSIQDLLSLVRAMPRYALPLVQAGLSFPETKRHFDGMVHDRLFGSATKPKVETRNEAWNRPSDPYYSDKVSRFFYDTRGDEGDFSYFIRKDRKAAVLRDGQRFSSDGPYRENFLVFRDVVGRFFLRWPSDLRHVPAYYLDSEGTAVDFFPEDEDFAEIYPGWTYEVFGVQFAVPNIGTNYRDFGDDIAPEETAAPAKAGSPDRQLELLELLEAADVPIADVRALSKHFRQISLRYHPLKHLQASDAEKARINKRYLEITNAYNELKGFYPRGS
jgi:hypothetical protein